MLQLGWGYKEEKCPYIHTYPYLLCLHSNHNKKIIRKYVQNISSLIQETCLSLGFFYNIYKEIDAPVLLVEHTIFDKTYEQVIL